MTRFIRPLPSKSKQKGYKKSLAGNPCYKETESNRTAQKRLKQMNNLERYSSTCLSSFSLCSAFQVSMSCHSYWGELWGHRCIWIMFASACNSSLIVLYTYKTEINLTGSQSWTLVVSVPCPHISSLPGMNRPMRAISPGSLSQKTVTSHNNLVISRWHMTCTCPLHSLTFNFVAVGIFDILLEVPFLKWS